MLKYPHVSQQVNISRKQAAFNRHQTTDIRFQTSDNRIQEVTQIIQINYLALKRSVNPAPNVQHQDDVLFWCWARLIGAGPFTQFQQLAHLNTLNVQPNTKYASRFTLHDKLNTIYEILRTKLSAKNAKQTQFSKKSNECKYLYYKVL